MRLGCDCSTAERAVEAVLDGIGQGLEVDRVVQLAGFGTLSARPRAERRVRNPVTHEWMDLPAATTVRFRPGHRLRERAAAPSGARTG